MPYLGMPCSDPDNSHEKTEAEIGVRDWSDGATSHRMPRIGSNHQEQGKDKVGSSPGNFRGSTDLLTP